MDQTSNSLQGEESTSITLKDVCQDCQSVFNLCHVWYDWDFWVSYLEHHNILDLESCVCPICRLLFIHLDKNAQKIRSASPLERSSVNIIPVGSRGEKYSFQLRYPTVSYKWGGEIEDPGNVEIFPASSNGNPRIGTIQEATDCERTWQLASKWLQTCRESHPKCGKRFLESKLPTRLIFVGTTDDDLKIVPSQLLSNKIQYLTLSHCWGRKTFMTLTRDNYSEFLTKVPPAALSKTFKDAIHSTRNLGFKFLWIDSLCILQGDEEDWQREAALMGQVYSNSALNLAASDAPDGDTGLFFERNTPEPLAWKISLPTTPDSTESKVWLCNFSDLTWRTMNKCVLATRSWVYQERFLSPRTLYFGRSQIAWECRTSKAHETFPEPIDDGKMSVVELGHDLVDDGTNYEPVTAWYQVVHVYSSGKLTYSRDKLIAISGVARLLAPHYGPRYFAGLWEKDMAVQMMWFVRDIKEPFDKSTSSYRAPSWSWASTDSQISIPSTITKENYKVLTEVVEADTTFLDGQFGEVTSGYVRLRCPPIFPGTLDINKKERGFFLLDLPGSQRADFSIYPDRALCEAEGASAFMPILEEFNREYSVQIWGLVLRAAGQDQYCRVGAFRSSDLNFKNLISDSGNEGKQIITII